MENLDLKQMSTMVDVIAEEKGLPKETVLDVIEQAIAAAWRKDNGDREMNVRAVLNTKTGEADVFVIREVIEDGLAYNPSTEIPLKDAGKNAKVGETVEEKFKVSSFGRVAAQTAKQVVIQRLREAENDAVLSAFEDKIGTIVTGTVSRVEPKLVRIDLGRANGIMPRSEQTDGEYYTVGNRIKVYVKNIEHGDRGAQLILSRGCAEFIECLFRQEVPELETGTVAIKGIAREAGKRTKISVMATTPGIDPVGTFVGGRGIRVGAVMNEIGDKEKIDIITWSDNDSEYIREALSPAEIAKVEILNSSDEAKGKDKKAKVYVTEDQQSIAIGKQGQNVRLASKLTGYDLDIELMKAPHKKKKQNVEDALLSAIEEETAEEAEAPTPKTAKTTSEAKKSEAKADSKE
ncbi:transcription termination/antitermination protein NusA [Candidatus Saccharibacteria bacterium]|nr:transcription termination/antitermination protein NusA [Candidatus Saccharibacteria bacterium]